MFALDFCFLVGAWCKVELVTRDGPGSPGELFLWPQADQSQCWTLGRSLEAAGCHTFPLIRALGPEPFLAWLLDTGLGIQLMGTCMQRPCLSVFPPPPMAYTLVPQRACFSLGVPPTHTHNWAHCQGVPGGHSLQPGHVTPKNPLSLLHHIPATSSSCTGVMPLLVVFSSGLWCLCLRASWSVRPQRSQRPGWASPCMLTQHLLLHPRFQVCDGGCNLSCGY